LASFRVYTKIGFIIGVSDARITAKEEQAIIVIPKHLVTVGILYDNGLSAH
jgi:hypothetical protein